MIRKERYLPLPPQADSPADPWLRLSGLLLLASAVLAAALLLGGAKVYGPQPLDVLVTGLAFTLAIGGSWQIVALAARSRYYYVPREASPGMYQYWRLENNGLTSWAIPERFYARTEVLAIAREMAFLIEGERRDNPHLSDTLNLWIRFRDRALDVNDAVALNDFYRSLLERQGDIRRMRDFLVDARRTEGELPFTFGGMIEGRPELDF